MNNHDKSIADERIPPMLIDQALDATSLLNTLCLFNVIFATALVMISLGPLDRGTSWWSRPRRLPLMFILFVVEVVFGCIYPLILLGLETFNPLDPTLIQVAIGLGVGLPCLMLIIVAYTLVMRPSDDQTKYAEQK